MNKGEEYISESHVLNIKEHKRAAEEGRGGKGQKHITISRGIISHY